jgi:type IV secretion system protein VirD4
VSEQKRALMLPQELREMGADRVIVLSDNCKPILGHKICYHTDPAFASRLHPPVKVPALRLDLHMARREGRIRALQADEPIDPSAIVVDDSCRPTITSPLRPIPAEVTAMADWLFASVTWRDADAATDTHGPSPDGLPDPTQRVQRAAARHQEPSPGPTWR